MFHVKQLSVKMTNCPICLSLLPDNQIIIKDLSISKEDFNVKTCVTCTAKVTVDAPSSENIGPYYQSEEYISHSGTKTGLVNSLYHIVRQFNLNNKYKLLRQFSKKGSVLDYGCGTGEFLAFLKKLGYTTTGIEPSEDARKYAETENGIKPLPLKALDNLEEEKYDIITAWHVVEHIHDLHTTLDALIRALKNKGKLIIAVPNHISYDAKKYGAFWAAYDVPRHLYHFNPLAMEKLMEKKPVQFLRTEPMVFDSYYVSMMSEKYKGNTGIGGLIKGALTGLKSNAKANSKNKAHSSLIYIFEKK